LAASAIEAIKGRAVGLCARESGVNVLPGDLPITPGDVLPKFTQFYWVLTVHLFKGKDYCFPKINTIAKEARCDHRTVTRAPSGSLRKPGISRLEVHPAR
jgi:hypothetical protein